jgi:hypothetical protein
MSTTNRFGQLVVFLLGFAPQYLQKMQLQNEVRLCNDKLEVSELRDMAGMILLEVLRQNYGTGRDYAMRYFAKLGEISVNTQDVVLKSSLEALLSKRDSIIASVAKADPVVQTHELPNVAR